MKVLVSVHEPAAHRGVDGSRPAVGADPAPATATADAFDATTPAGEVARLEVRRLVGEWLAHEPGARRGHDPEEVHQVRVIARRLDATLGLFKRHLPASLVRARKMAKALLRALGATRDLDVQLEGLAAYTRKLPASERAALEPLKARLALERAQAHARMVRVLEAEPARRWVETLTAATTEPEAVAADGDSAREASVASLLERRVRRRFRRLRKAVDRLGEHSSMDDYHRVRRRAKQLRYALEASARLYGKPADEMLRSLRRLQDELGSQQDASMARGHLIALAADPACALPPATLFLMGRLAEHHARVTAQARGTLAKHWRKVRGRRWKALRERLAELRDAGPDAADPPVADAALTLAATADSSSTGPHAHPL
ncbi:MAG TPA: CHAD domain-containing protein [Steroidobacteraceae bacterium]|nr:CHAD domain-containing protein [Steroidobacteraceae bacterium]